MTSESRPWRVRVILDGFRWKWRLETPEGAIQIQTIERFKTKSEACAHAESILCDNTYDLDTVIPNELGSKLIVTPLRRNNPPMEGTPE